MLSHRSPFLFVAVTKKFQILKKKKKKNRRVECKARELICRRSRVACWAGEGGEAGEWFLFRELFHIPLLVRADTSLPLIGAQERTGSICCQNQIIFCQQSRRENWRLSQPCGHTYTCMDTHTYLGFDHYRSLKGRTVVFFYLFIDLWQFCDAKLLRWNWCWISKNTSSAGVVPDSFMTEGTVWSCRATEKLPVSQEENYVLVWVVQNHHKSIYSTLNQISLGADTTFYRVVLSISEGLPTVTNRSVIYTIQELNGATVKLL